MKIQIAAGLFAVAMMSAIPGVSRAQDNPTTSPNSGQTQSRPSKSVTGCLQKGDSANTFTLTTSDGTAWSLRPGKGVHLAAHVGHTITVTGTVPQANGGSAGSNGSSGMSSDSGSANRLHVRSVKMVSESCQNQSQ